MTAISWGKTIETEHKVIAIAGFGIFLLAIFGLLDAFVLSKMTGTQEFNRLGLAFILVLAFVLEAIGIIKMDC